MAASIPIIHNPRLLLGLPCRAAVQTTRLAFTTPGNGLVDYPSHNQVEQQPQAYAGCTGQHFSSNQRPPTDSDGYPDTR